LASLPLNQIVLGDCLGVLKEFAEESIDLVVTDPPYGYSFMGKDWDKAVPSVEVWRECLRVLKCGAFAFVMSSPRQDVLSQMIVRLGQAGFETGFTSIYWTYASGFPKAMNIGKAVDKRPINMSEFARLIKTRREELGLSTIELAEKGHFYGEINHGGSVSNWEAGLSVPTLDEYNKLVPILNLKTYEKIERVYREIIRQKEWTNSVHHFVPNEDHTKRIQLNETLPATEQAKALDGSYGGFQPKPAVEVVLVAMKPLCEKTYVDQALKNGKGISWLDDARIPYVSEDDKAQAIPQGRITTRVGSFAGRTQEGTDKELDRNEWKEAQKGRFPANLCVSDDVLNDGVERQSKFGKSSVGNDVQMGFRGSSSQEAFIGDVGSFSRYFDLDAWWSKTVSALPESVRRTFPFLICVKASKSERDKGLEGLPLQHAPTHNVEGRDLNNPKNILRPGMQDRIARNVHPTVKPLKLMSYLVTLGSRKDDVVLDPFCGSGTTCLASEILNRKWIGIDNNADYCVIARKRLAVVPEKLERFMED
jgi:DNA modification methylase/transcriptional regulator with XRE-family HTH domain